VLIDMELDKAGEDRQTNFHWHHFVEQISLVGDELQVGGAMLR